MAPPHFDCCPFFASIISCSDDLSGKNLPSKNASINTLRPRGQNPFRRKKMKIINVTLHVKPELASDYQQFISQLVAGSRAEAGNLSYDHFQSLTDPNKYEIIEHWQDAQAVASHNETSHFKHFLAGIDSFLDAPLEIIRMDYSA